MTPDPVVLRAEDSVAVAVQKMAVGGKLEAGAVEPEEGSPPANALPLFHLRVRQSGSPARFSPVLG